MSPHWRAIRIPVPSARAGGADRSGPSGRAAPAPGPFTDIVAWLIGLVDKVTRRLRAAHRACRTVVLRLRFADYERVTRSRTLVRPSADTATLVRAATELLEAHRGLIDQRGLTLVGVSLTNLSDPAGVQLVLPFDQGAELDAAIDQVKDRFGAAAVTRASLLGQELRDSVPILGE